MSQPLTANDLLNLAASTREAANTLADYLYGNWNDPTVVPEQARLQSLHQTLITASGDLITHAVDVTLDDGDGALNQIQASIADAQQALNKINDVKKAIGIATALISLAAAIPTGNAGTIISSIQAVRVAANAVV